MERTERKGKRGREEKGGKERNWREERGRGGETLL